MTTTCYVYGRDFNSCSGDVASLTGFDTSIRDALLAQAQFGTLDRNPCTENPAGLSTTLLGTNSVDLTVAANCEILAVAVSLFPLEGVGRTLVGTAANPAPGYDLTFSGGASGGIQRLDGRRSIRVTANGEMEAIAVTVCCTASPRGNAIHLAPPRPSVKARL